MTRSIRRFLLFNLLLSVTITSSLTAVGTYFLNDKAIQHHLDIQLQQITSFLNAVIAERSNLYSFKAIQSLLDQKTEIIKIETKNNGIVPLSNQFHFQVWNDKNKLVLHSFNSLTKKLSLKREGFSNVDINKQTWRVFAAYDPKMKFTFIVAEPFNFRSQLEQEITWDNLLILIWIYPLLGLLIWLTVGRSLTSLQKTAKKLAHRSTTDFSPLDNSYVPIEVRPLINELNELFMRLQEEFERNKRFASDAAHELRTPLAALKTQTQVALLANTEEERKTVAKKLLLGVDRCTHIVQQLLTLSRLGQQAHLNDIKHLNFTSATAEIIAQLAPLALEKQIDIEFKSSKEPILLSGNETMISILIRNLVDNAIRYTPEHGNVTVELYKKENRIILRVSDSGPGIPAELQKRVFERFYRILGTQASGSGLGLAIVQQIAEFHQAKIHLGVPENGKGLQIDIIFPETFYRQPHNLSPASPNPGRI